MAIVPGVRIGPYVVVESLGSGGMGEVYRATDTSLKRDVALKVLAEPFLFGPNAIARFEREAEILASLNHPNIAHLYGLEKVDAATALVMELVEGPTLAGRIARGPLPPSEAVNVALQIASALEAAHERGIVHRDLKPDNIKLRPDGVVKVLDFGIAKALGPPTNEGAAKGSAITEIGTVLGTTAYMSPEQLRGGAVDERADIWAFGCVLFELLTGRTAFPAGNVAAPLEREPDMDSLPTSVRPNVRTTIELCLKKDLAERIADIRDVKLALKGTFESGPHLAQPLSAATTMGRRATPVVAALIVGGILAGAYIWSLEPSTNAAPVTRFVVIPPPSTRLASLIGSDIAISPDGKRLAYYAYTPDASQPAGETRPPVSLYLRDLDELEAMVIPGSSIYSSIQNMYPFFSADGESIGFWDSDPDRGLMSVPLDGGATQNLVDFFKFLGDLGPSFMGAAWTNDTLILSSGLRLHRIVAGGAPEALTTETLANIVMAPALLPGERGVLFSILVRDDMRTHVAVLDLQTREVKTLIEDGTAPSFTATGHIVFARGTTLLAAPFDVTRLAVTGPAVAVLEGVRHPDPVAAVDYALSPTGTLVYVPDDGLPLRARTPIFAELLWVDRTGRVERAVSELVANPQNPRLSPDGKRLALDVGPSADAELWIYDLTGRPATPIVTDRRTGMSVWNSDGTQLAFYASPEDGPAGVYTVPADGGTDPTLFYARSGLVPAVWTTESELLLVTLLGDIMAVPATPQGELREVVASEARELHPALSPNGRWLAYASNRSGRLEIWVKEYPGGAAAVRVSANGGQQPAWAPDGRELFFVDEGAMMTVAVETEPGFSAQTPVELFKVPFEAEPLHSLRFYDVAPDGRFLVTRRQQADTSADAATSTREVVVVENWFEELKRLVPTE